MNAETHTSKIRLSWDICSLFRRLIFENVASVAPVKF